MTCYNFNNTRVTMYVYVYMYYSDYLLQGFPNFYDNGTPAENNYGIWQILMAKNISRNAGDFSRERGTHFKNKKNFSAL